MAVMIVSKKPHETVVKECICKNCGYTLSYTPVDVIKTTYTDYSGTSEAWNYIVCLNEKCLNKIEVRI